MRKTPRPADIFYELQELCVDLVNYQVTGVKCNGKDCTMSVQEAFTHEIAKIVSISEFSIPCLLIWPSRC